MDGPHDLGGRQGFGPVPVDHDYVPFGEDWEGRVWAICMAVEGPDWTLDWWRHLVETIPAAAYAPMPYFQRFLMGHVAGFAIDGTFTVEELATGRNAGPVTVPPPPWSVDDVLARERSLTDSFARPIDRPAAFAHGDRVRAAAHGATGHTRLPGYARGRLGRVVAHHGAHVLPDAKALGREEADHLYTVAFAGEELWGEGAEPGLSIRVDLWERYLAPA